ncbi:hypothetical protein MRX96_055876 [Rhipicephalus microplus]
MKLKSTVSGDVGWFCTTQCPFSLRRFPLYNGTPQTSWPVGSLRRTAPSYWDEVRGYFLTTAPGPLQPPPAASWSPSFLEGPVLFPFENRKRDGEGTQRFRGSEGEVIQKAPPRMAPPLFYGSPNCGVSGLQSNRVSL